MQFAVCPDRNTDLLRRKVSLQPRTTGGGGFEPGASTQPSVAMKPLTKELFRKTTATGLMLLLFLSLLTACAARHMPDWSRVQAVPPKTKTEVLLYKDEAPQGSQKIQGHFDSATVGSITLRLKDGQTRTLEKQAVHKVLTRRPFSKRWPGWVALGVTLTILAAHASGFR